MIKEFSKIVDSSPPYNIVPDKMNKEITILKEYSEIRNETI